MSIRTPKIPATYRAIDSAIFAENGPPLDAFTADTIVQAHNRLVAAAAPIFCVAFPNTDSTFGEETVSRYSVRAGRRWGRLVGDVVTPKKPGANLADFRAQLRIPEDELVDLQVVTLAAPQWDRPGHVTVKGTGDWATYSIDGVPVDPGVMERCALWVRSSGALATAPTTYGTPVTGEIHRVTFSQMNCLGTGGTSVAWNEVPAMTFASAGYYVNVIDPDSRERATLEISAVNMGQDLAGTYGVLHYPPFSSDLLQTINSSHELWTFEIVSGRRVDVASFAGATQQRTR